VLFERHAKAIYNYCFRSSGRWAVAEDLLSVVFLEAWRRRETELEPGGVLPWLYGIAVNVVRNQRRSERRYWAALRRFPGPELEPDFAEASGDRVDDEKQMLRALALVRRLSVAERDVFVLCAWLELSYEDASKALDVPLGTVRSRLSRARARLRELDPAGGHLEDGSAKQEVPSYEP
jgi:RNA polymerase sigma-70 factor (ECF subfamily)